LRERDHAELAPGVIACTDSNRAPAASGTIAPPRKEQRMLAQVELTPVAPSDENELPG
jgi:hypothetical protein